MSEQQGQFDLKLLAGKVAVVTGAANHGIGWGIARHAAGVLGMHVAIIDLHQKLVDQAVAELKAYCSDVTVIGCRADVTVPEELDEARETIQQALPGEEIGAVFANAGVIFYGTILNSKLDHWLTTMNVNVIGVVNTIKAFLPVLQAQQGPSIFSNTASVGGLVRGDMGAAAYQASKHAVVALTEALSLELAKKSPQVRVHVLCPCIVQSGLPQTSHINQQVKAGELADVDIERAEQAQWDFAMTPERHAEQVFDHIAAGHFYMITDNVRPYVDHDYPFDGLGIVRERYENLLQLKLDNSDALAGDQPASAILKGPMFQQQQRQRRDDK